MVVFLHGIFFDVMFNGLDTPIGSQKPTVFIVALLQLVSGNYRRPNSY
jgi:hypothetical protein